MSSSTFNSKKRGLLATAAVLALLLGALEVVTRVVLFPASKDLSRFMQYPEQARALAAAPGLRIALVGNSTTQEGVDPAAFRDALGAALGKPVSASLFVADGAGIATMRWIVEREFWKQRLAPDLLVVTYFGRELEDGEKIDVGRLAQFFVDRSDWPRLFELELPGLEERADLIVSSVWATAAARDRIKERVLDLIPGYKETISEVNAANFHHDQLLDYPVSAQPSTHEALRRFLARAHEQHVKVCFVAYPTKATYDVSPEARQLIRDAGFPLIDLRDLGLPAEAYADNIHVNARGREVFTRRLVDSLARLWR